MTVTFHKIVQVGPDLTQVCSSTCWGSRMSEPYLEQAQVDVLAARDSDPALPPSAWVSGHPTVQGGASGEALGLAAHRHDQLWV